jgi:hypothetical protein
VRRVDRQTLVIEVLKEMLLSTGSYSEDNYLARLAHAVQTQAAKDSEGGVCAKCGKPMSPRHDRCMYCGEFRPFDLI